MVYTLRFSSLKCSLFHNSNLFGSCIIHILYTECAKIKKNNSGAERLNNGVMDWIDLAQDRDRRWALVNALVNL